MGVAPVRAEASYPGAAVPPDELAPGAAWFPDEFALDGAQLGDELAPGAVRSPDEECSPVVSDSLGEAWFAHGVGSPFEAHSAVQALRTEVLCCRVDCFLGEELGWRPVVERRFRRRGCKVLLHGLPLRLHPR